MERMDFTDYDIKPKGMVNYLRYNGAHFNKNLCEFAVGKMKRKGSDDKLVRITPYSKSEVEEMLKTAGIELENSQLYDAVYVANMCKADYYGSAIEDAKHVALFVRDTLDDSDGYDGQAFNRWYADMCHKGLAIDWEEMI